MKFNLSKLRSKPGTLRASPVKYRRAMLVGDLAILIFAFTLFYLILDYFNGFYKTLYVYVIAMVISTFVFYINRKGYHEPAKIILFITALFTIFTLGSSNFEDTQTYVIFFPVIIVSFTLFEYKALWKSFFMALLAIVLFAIDFGTEWSIVQKSHVDAEDVKVFVVTNYIISILSTLYIGYFWVRTNYLSEKRLIQRQEKLNNLTVALQKSERRYELAISGSKTGLWDWNIEKNTIYHGKKWKEMLGFSEDEVVDINIGSFFSMIHPEDRERVKEETEKHLEQNTDFRTEYRIRKKDGSYIWVLDSAKAVLNEQEKPVRMVGSIIDISDRKKNEEKIKKQKDLLEKANDELDRFVYITSHDLKAPLLSIEGLIHLAEISDDETEIRHCLHMMKDRIKGLENFISDIINYSRNVRSGIVKQELNLKNTITTIVDELLYMKDVDKIRFNVDVDPSLTMLTDEKRLTVILKNLIFNAIKYHNYNQENPEIKIAASRENKHVLISVKDNGEGIREEMLKKIFDMFFRASEKSTGSGLGLYIVKEMAGKLNGNVAVTSEFGKGSQFTVSLPDMT